LHNDEAFQRGVQSQTYLSFHLGIRKANENENITFRIAAIE
jgi:hypothetical protein